MREQFDKKLANKIKSSFKDLEGEFDASEWDKFSKIYFRKKSKPMVVWIKWLSGIAAAILIGIALFTMYQPALNPTSDIQNTIAENGKGFSDQNPTEKTSSPEVKAFEEIPSEKKNSTQAELTQKEKISNQKIESNKEIKKPIPQTYNPEQVNKSISSGTVKNGVSNLDENNNVGKPIFSTPENSNTGLTAKVDKQEITQQEAIAQIEQWKGEETIASSETILKENNVKDPMKLGVLVAPQTISNSTQSINFGAGLMSEFSFSKKLKLDVGMAFARQNISPTSGGNILTAGVSNDSESADLKAAAFTGNIINTSRELSFGQFEIPINLKYKVMDKKESDLYLISGLSNMVYLNQKDVTTYSSANLSSANFAGSQQMLNTIKQTVEPDPQSNGIDTGRMLNFGVGFEQNLKNGTFLSIEPFYKLSLGNQTFTNQQFSIGGINLRMNFQLKTKKE